MLKSETRQIADREGTSHRWDVSQLPGRRSYALFLKLSAAVLPAVGGAMDAVKPILNLTTLDPKRLQVSELLGSLSGVDFGSAGGAFGTLAEKILAYGAEDVAMELLAGARRDGKDFTPALCDLEMAGNVKEFLHALAFALEINYSDFLPGSGDGFFAVLRKIQKPSESQAPAV